VSQSHVFAGVGGYYGTKDKSGKAGIFRRAADAADWDYVLGHLEAFAVFVHPRDANLVFAGTNDGVYRSTDRGATFKRTNFPDKGVQIWSFLADPGDPKRMLAGGSPVSVYRSEDGGERWKRMPNPALPQHVSDGLLHVLMATVLKVMRVPCPSGSGVAVTILSVLMTTG